MKLFKPDVGCETLPFNVVRLSAIAGGGGVEADSSEQLTSDGCSEHTALPQRLHCLTALGSVTGGVVGYAELCS